MQGFWIYGLRLQGFRVWVIYIYKVDDVALRVAESG